MAPGFFQGVGNRAADEAGWDGFPVTASAGISEEPFICLAGRWILRWNGNTGTPLAEIKTVAEL